MKSYDDMDDDEPRGCVLLLTAATLFAACAILIAIHLLP